MAGKISRFRSLILNGNRSNGSAYLTKRILMHSARKAFLEAAEETMEVLGYNVIAEDGWVVKVYADGKKERISKIEPVKRPKILFD